MTTRASRHKNPPRSPAAGKQVGSEAVRDGSAAPWGLAPVLHIGGCEVRSIMPLGTEERIDGKFEQPQPGNDPGHKCQDRNDHEGRNRQLLAGQLDPRGSEREGRLDGSGEHGLERAAEERANSTHGRVVLEEPDAAPRNSKLVGPASVRPIDRANPRISGSDVSVLAKGPRDRPEQEGVAPGYLLRLAPRRHRTGAGALICVGENLISHHVEVAIGQQSPNLRR